MVLPSLYLIFCHQLTWLGALKSVLQSYALKKKTPPSSSLSSSSCSSALAQVSVMSWTLSLRYYALECHFGILPRPHPLTQLQMHNRSFSIFYRHRNRSQQLQQLNPHFCSTLSVFFAFVFVTVVTDSNRVRLFI